LALGQFDTDGLVPDCDDPAGRVMEKLEFFFRMAINGGADRCVIIGIAGHGENPASSGAMLSYLFTKIQREMGISAFFVRFRQDRFFVLCRHDRLRGLEQHLNEANILTGDMFSFEEIASPEKP
jgi:hypothetical protein